MPSDKKSKTSSIRKSKGKLHWPLKSRVLVAFGQKTNTGVKLAGVHLSPKKRSEKGKQVHASGQGQVRYADWFGGYGLEGTGQWMASIGLEPGYLMALLAGSAEFFGGIALLIGLLTRPTAFILSLTMIVAIVSVHLANGLFLSNNGYEFGLALLAASVSLNPVTSDRVNTTVESHPPAEINVSV